MTKSIELNHSDLLRDWGYTITKRRALSELRNHQIKDNKDYDIDEFLDDCGDKDYYDVSAVLIWLGY